MPQIDWEFTWAVVVVGLVVVFAVLLILVFLNTMMGKFFISAEAKKANKNNTSTKAEIKPIMKANPQGNVATMDMFQSNVGDEVIAAISAAISIMMSEDGIKKPFVIRSIKKQKNTGNAWNFAGISENTRQF